MGSSYLDLRNPIALALPLPDGLVSSDWAKSCYRVAQVRIPLAGRVKQQGEREDVKFADHSTQDCELSSLPSCDAGQ